MKDKDDKGGQQKEIQSLIGKIDKNAMGERDEKSRPKPVKIANKKGVTSANNILFKSGNIFQ